MSKISLSLEQIDNAYCVYTHSITHPDGRNELIYVGSCRTVDLMRAPDARRNSKWREIMRNPAFHIITIEIRAFYEHRNIAVLEAERLGIHLKAICNTTDTRDKPQTIRCVETGEIFETAAQACKEYDIKPSAMSNHLNNKQSYRTVRNLTFERV